MKNIRIPRLVVAGSSSGVGKTSVSCAISYGLQQRGYSVQPFKVGPDYIDPSYLSYTSNNDARNLDPWLMGTQELMRSFVRNSTSDVSLIEGVMGYYDGFSGGSNYSSTHHVATILESPVVLVLDASKTSRSIAATALGFSKFHKNSRIAGVILNKVGSSRHARLCKEALDQIKIPLLGAIPRDSVNSLQSRHLGLIPAVENKEQKRKIRKIARTISEFLDFDKIYKICKDTQSLPEVKESSKTKPQVTVGVALDSSFNFYYHDNFDALKRHGAKLVFFSPVSDSRLPECDGLYIGGGFPEILGHPLEKNQRMRRLILKFAQEGKSVYAECGGLMYLTKSVEHMNKRFRMVGLFDAHTKMTGRMTLSYTQGKFDTSCIVAPKSAKLRGHEFHYSKMYGVSKDSSFAYRLEKGVGIKDNRDGLMAHNTLASYGHLYFDSAKFAKSYVTNCMKNTRR